MDLRFAGEVFSWRGPAPHHFVAVPEDGCSALDAVAPMVSYGWGMIPATVRIGTTSWTTSLWPRDAGYVVPLKAAVRGAEGIDLGDTVTVLLTIEV
ncbi:MAG: hypothetical protein JWP74_1443 [Marmoricola sp.]|nr:hypothetical protein [Marmoricola sp.]